MNVKNTIAKAQTRSAQIMLAVFGMFFYNFALAAGGLDEATNQANEIKTWAYGFLGVCVFIYLIYLVVMALLEKKQWGDVLVGVGYVALAGAIVVLGEWAWSVWGS
jgi:hypothetical protein